MENESMTFEIPVRTADRGFPELRWAGKRPYRFEHYYPAQLRESYGEPADSWMNMIFWGDNLQVMGHLLRDYKGQIDLIYIDPPFDSKADYKKKIELKDVGSATSDSSSFEEKQYGDIWANDEYLQFMYERLLIMSQLLSEKGSIYLHCDWHKSHHLRLIMDEVFGVDCFRNEITWRRQIPRGMKVYAQYYAFSSDCLLIYSKNPEKATWHRQVKINELTLEEAEAKYARDEKGFFRTSDPGSYSFESLLELHKEGRLYAPNNGEIIVDYENRRITSSKKGNIAVKYYREQVGDKVLEEVTVDNIWNDIPGMGIVSSEFIGYPTQKPEALLERVINASTDPGDLVFDCFMGSGTTQTVAMKLGRRFIGADINLGSIQTTTKRLLSSAKELKTTDEYKLYTGFEVYNVNNYDFFRNPVEAREILISALGIKPYPKTSIWDGELDGRVVKLMPINRIAAKSDLEPLKASLPYKLYEQRREDDPSQPVERITIICMGHEPDLRSALEQELCDFKLDVNIVDILRDKRELQLKREAEADIIRDGDKLVIRAFYPMNLMQKLTLEKEYVDDWRRLVESVMIDFDFDGEVMKPDITDIPGKNELVSGVYDIPENCGVIKVKITDLLSESLETEV